MPWWGRILGAQHVKPRQYLEFHGQQWRVVVPIPRKLQPLLGVTRLKHALGTSDLKLANELKWAHVTRFKDQIAQARRAMASNEPLRAEAFRLRLRHSESDDESRADISVRADALEEVWGSRAAADFAEIARGLSTPLDFHQDAFLSHRADYRLKSQGDFKRVLGWLIEWRRADHKGAYLEDISRRIASQFVSEFLCVGRSRQKAGAYLGFLREYWRWLCSRGDLTENPWVGVVLPPAPRQALSAAYDGGKRPFTDDEAATLLYGPLEEHVRGPAVSYLPDLMRIAALSGMRLEEIAQLRLSDCTGGMFRVRQGKTANARRDVPIHSELLSVVARLSAGRDASTYLIDGLPDVPASRESRSDPASKAFTRYRRKMAVDERPNGKAKSNVEFHSWRRWFLRKVSNALENGASGFTPWTVADVVGHEDEDIKGLLRLTMQHYPGPSGEAARRAVVESVWLPPPPAPGAKDAG